ncbi:MAG: CRISPR-associated protein [Tildeniella torsiva UHER 1998/13D]|jgi:CRISPR-associated protein Cmr3|nr:CRISPR-associated protein [Tildeniella torsiva UHER 1998/13D]
MFTHIITISPLGFLYGSAGAFLSPENLVGRSGAKFPPDAATLAGLLFSANKHSGAHDQVTLRDSLFLAGPFWANVDDPHYFYVPVPRHKILGRDDTDQWEVRNYQWWRDEAAHPDLEADYHWQRIDTWDYTPDEIKANGAAAQDPWTFLPLLHPSLKSDERNVRDENGLFLENAVQMLPNQWDGSQAETCLVYLSTVPLEDGWYRFGGESHLVEVASHPIADTSPIAELLQRPIDHAFALLGPGLWGSTHLSLRYPRHADFSDRRPMMLTDRPQPHRYRLGSQAKSPQGEALAPAGRLSRGRYAVPPGTVYLFKEAIGRSWWDWPEAWFPKEGFSLKHLGCNLCLPVDISRS